VKRHVRNHHLAGTFGWKKTLHLQLIAEVVEDVPSFLSMKHKSKVSVESLEGQISEERRV